MLTWRGPQATTILMARLTNGFIEAGNDLRDGIKQAIEIQGPPRSTPGNPPHKDTGALHDDYFSVTIASATGIRTIVGSSLDYDPFLEVGTTRMAPRPHARSTFNVMWPGLVQTILS